MLIQKMTIEVLEKELRLINSRSEKY